MAKLSKFLFKSQTSHIYVRIARRFIPFRFASCKQNLSAFSKDKLYLFENKQTTLNQIAKLEAAKPWRRIASYSPIRKLVSALHLVYINIIFSSIKENYIDKSFLFIYTLNFFCLI